VSAPRPAGRADRELCVGIDARELQGRPTGTGRYLRNLLRCWSEAGSGRLVLFFQGAPPPDPVLSHERIVCRSVGEAGTRGSVWQERDLPGATRAAGVDVLFAPAYSCPQRLSLPRVTTVHDLSFRSIPEDFPPLEALRRRLLVGASVRVSGAIVAVSEFTRREICAWFPDAASRTRVIHHGSDDDLPPAPERAAARASLGARGPVLVSVGAIFNRRRLPTLLGALALLRRARPDVELRVVGENRTHPPLDLERASRERGLERSVRFEGFVSEARLAAHYAAADAAVCLSEYEGFGLPVLEAMSRGVPVVASRRPAHRELFEGAALLADPGNEAEIAGALERLLADPALRDRYASLGRERAGRFSWRRAAAEHWDLFRQVAG
jgi:glycosyltransferase involved in cell wall biosynthesis